jgi:cell division septal protein FtsQ
VLTALGAAASAAAIVALLVGPWLRVTEVTWAGERYTPPERLAEVLGAADGRSVLAVDTASLAERLERIPSVARAAVTTSITGRVSASVEERQVAFTWETASARFLGAADGTVFAALPRDADLPPELADLPRVSDARFAARLISVGDRIGDGVLDAAMRLAAVDPAALGSSASTLDVRVDDEYGFRLVAAEPGWEVAMGVYGVDPRETASDAAARMERQVTAVRTLFARESEAEIGWVDVRNPGKVYFRAKG